MPGRTPAEAVSAFLDPLQRAVSCVTRTPLQISRGGRKTAAQPHMLSWDQDRPVPLKISGGSRIALDLTMRYEIVRKDTDQGLWAVSTRAYYYTVETEDGAQVFAYHWHPRGKSSVTFPHLHLGHARLHHDGVFSRKAHMPTGRISLESVIRLCIREYGIQPLRDDWEQVLANSEDLFTMWRSWH